MFGENKMRLYVAATWIICFVAMWLFFNAVLPRNEFEKQLNQIEKSVVAKDWDNAKESMRQLNDLYMSRRMVIQMNNATEIFTAFEMAMGQLEASVRNEMDSAIEHVGAIRYSLDFVMKAFSGP